MSRISHHHAVCITPDLGIISRDFVVKNANRHPFPQAGISCAPISAPLQHLGTLSYTRTSDKTGLGMRPEGEQEGNDHHCCNRMFSILYGCVKPCLSCRFTVLQVLHPPCSGSVMKIEGLVQTLVQIVVILLRMPKTCSCSRSEGFVE